MDETSPSYSLELLKIAIPDHKFLVTYSDLVNQLFAGGAARQMRETVNKFRSHIQENLLEHFALEDDHVFPALEAARPGEMVSQLLVELRADHELLRAEARQLEHLLSCDSGAGCPSAALRCAILKFVSNLRDHASKEHELFLFLVGQYRQSLEVEE